MTGTRYVMIFVRVENHKPTKSKRQRVSSSIAHKMLSDIHGKQDVSLAYAAFFGSPGIQHGELEPHPAQVARKILDLLLVRFAVDADDKLRASKVLTAG